MAQRFVDLSVNGNRKGEINGLTMKIMSTCIFIVKYLCDSHAVQ